MNAIAALSAADPVTTGNGDASQAATSAFGLGFDALLKIILTQLTYQDPLKPMDNFEFVSQLAQFSQIQQGQTANDRLESLVSAQATGQATGLLGTEVDVNTVDGMVTGKVIAVTFDNGVPRITIEPIGGSGATSGLSISDVIQVRQGD